MSKINLFAAIILLAASFSSRAAFDPIELSVWANEASVATYTYNYKNFMQRQKEIAKYFTAAAWTNFSNALLASKIPETVKTNSYFVSAVALMPPTIKTTGLNQWQANMPLLIVYQNPQYRQKQTLDVTINFIQAPSGQGQRGLAITSFQTKPIKPSCKCDMDETIDATDEQQSS